MSGTLDLLEMTSSGREKQAIATSSSSQAARGGMNEPSGKCVSDWIKTNLPFL